MVWARFSDDWADQPAIITLTAPAFRTYVESVLYVAKFATDGLLPADAIRLRDKRTRAALLAAGLWQECESPGTFRLPLWQEHVPSAADLERARTAQAKRQRRHRGEDQP